MDILYWVEKVTLYFKLTKSFYYKWLLDFVKCFLFTYWYDHVIFFFSLLILFYWLLSYVIGYSVLGTAAAAKSLQSCPTLCDPIDSNPPGSPIPGILQARTLEWVAISFSNAWKWKVKAKSLSRFRLLATPDPMDCILPGSSVHGIFQARVLEWSAIAFSSVRHKHVKIFYIFCF